MELVIARHGQTHANAEGIWQGVYDSELTELGIRQIESLGKKLSGHKIQKIYCSDLGRSAKTAILYDQHYNCDINITKLLREVNFGDWENKKRIELEKKSLWPAYLKDRYGFVFPRGESYRQAREERARELLGKIMKGKEKNVMLVGHYGINICILGEMLGLAGNRIFELEMTNRCAYIINLGEMNEAKKVCSEIES